MIKKNEAHFCSVCGANAAQTKVMTQQFAYSNGQNDVFLTADIPVESCSECGEMVVGEKGEQARHEAVCRYLGRLSPAEIKQIRAKLGLSQRAFADKTSAGLASIKRWETGAVIQSSSMDKILRSVAVGTDVVEQEDGRATYSFDLDKKTEKLVAELGLQLILICGAYGLDIEDALQAVQDKGKEQSV